MSTGHTIADNSKNAACSRNFHALYLTLTQFAVERIFHDLLGLGCFCLWNGETDGMLGTALRNQDHRNPMLT